MQCYVMLLFSMTKYSLIRIDSKLEIMINVGATLWIEHSWREAGGKYRQSYNRTREYRETDRKTSMIFLRLTLTNWKLRI